MLTNVPPEMGKAYWEWLVKNHYFTKDFKKVSCKNSKNRAKCVMPHQSGSKLIREIIYQNGGQDGNPLNLATIFFETRKKDEIVATMNSNPSMSNVELEEKCVGHFHGNHVFCYGGGIKLKDVK